MKKLSILVFLCWFGCRSSFYVGDDGDDLVIVDKKIPADKNSRTVYTVKNISQERGLLTGGKLFTIQSRQVFHVGDTVQLYRMHSSKWRGGKEKWSLVSSH